MITNIIRLDEVAGHNILITLIQIPSNVFNECMLKNTI